MRQSLKLAFRFKQATNTIIAPHVKNGDWQKAFQILKDAGRGADVVHFTLGLRSCASTAAWEVALSILPWIARLRLSPDQHFFSSALTVCSRAARWREALAILSQNPVPSLVAHSAAMAACEKAGKWKMVLHMLSYLTTLRLQPDRIAFTSCVGAIEKIGLWQAALQLLEDMKGFALQADVVNMSGILSAMEKGHRWKNALALVSDMTLKSLRPSTISYSAVISACEKGQVWEQALHLFQEVRDYIPLDVAIMSAVTAACDVGGRWQDALSLLQATSALSIQGTAVLYNACISACGRSMQWEAALSILRSQIGSDATGRNCAVQACAAARRWSLAASLVEGCHHNTTLSVVFAACLACQQLITARRMYFALLKSRSKSEEEEILVEGSHRSLAQYPRRVAKTEAVGEPMSPTCASPSNVSAAVARRLLDVHRLRST